MERERERDRERKSVGTATLNGYNSTQLGSVLVVPTSNLACSKKANYGEFLGVLYNGNSKG